LLGHSDLDFVGAAQCVDGAGELRQKTVARGFDDAAPIFRNLGVDQLVAVGSEQAKGSGLVLTDKAAIADDVGGENGSEPPLDPLSAQLLSPRWASDAICAASRRGSTKCIERARGP
jgi:hypothetical protein